MVDISLLTLLLHCAGLLSVTVCHQTTLRLEAKPGDNMTIWFRHGLRDPAHINWFKHTNISVPDRLACQYYTLKSSPTSCTFVLQSRRAMMSLNSENTSLTITGINYTDSGLYYCSIQRNNHITFSNTTYLLVKERNETLFESSKNISRADCPLLFLLTVVFGTVIGILISVLLIILRCRKQHRDDAGCEVKEEDGDGVNYAALQFSSKMRSPRHSEVSCVVYSSVRR